MSNMLIIWSQVIPSQSQQSEERDQLRGRWGEKVDIFEEKDKSESWSIWLQEEETWTRKKVRNKVVVMIETINLEKNM